MNSRTFALIFGVVFLLVGIAGFIPALNSPHSHPEVSMQGGLSLLFGLFPVNWVHNLVHIVFGVWGLAAASRPDATRAYFKSVAVIYAVLTIMGLLPFLRTTFGLVPLYGNDIWLHALLAGVAAYFGFRREPASAVAHG